MRRIVTSIAVLAAVALFACQGSPGPAGDTGPQGPTGPQGTPGPQGVPGPTGAPGEIGQIGPAGATGATGATGANGATGPQGAIGPTGADGPQGVAGPVGPTGATGATGAMPTIATNGGLTGDGSTANPLAVSFAGSGTATTAARSDHTHAASDLTAGALKLANTTAACNASAAGTVRWTGTALEVCTGTAWKSAVLDADGSSQANAAQSCAEIKSRYPSSANGTYFIDPDGGSTANAFQVYCDMTTEGGGWTLIAINHYDAHVTAFYQTWAVYKAGFGDVTTNTSNAGWIGNENIYLLTRDGTHTLRVTTNNRTYHYVGWHIGDESTKYRMFVPNSDYNAANAATGLRYAQGMKFSTYDQDNDLYSGNCANAEHSGWWYNQCWYTQYADQAANQTYWNEPDAPGDPFATIDLYVK